MDRMAKLLQESMQLQEVTAPAYPYFWSLKASLTNLNRSIKQKDFWHIQACNVSIHLKTQPGLIVEQIGPLNR